ncbi:MAG TPA: hypothetical protein PLD10_13620 [Rhodopila sp.]|nr:hypothetical protein [Rhodopila sp.]
MPAESLLDIKKQKVEAVLGELKSTDAATSAAAGRRLLHEAHRYALPVKDYLRLAVDTAGTQFSDLNGYEMSLSYLNLPVRDDFKAGVVLQAASDTFQTYPGTRALFPPVIDDMLYWTTRINQIERIEDMLAVSRVISGPELLFTVVDDDGSEYKSFTVPEMGRIPVRSIRTHESTVRMFKHGSAIRTSYEFNRRARLDMLTPFAARVARELELSKIGACITSIINGDNSNYAGAAPTVSQSSYNTPVGVAATNGTLSYKHLLYWLVQRAKSMVPVDTVIGNYDALYQWMGLFQPTITGFVSQAQEVADASGFQLQKPNIFPGPVKFVVASAAPAGKLIGITRAETIEELREAGGDVAEEDRAILNQTITYVRSEVTGYRLLFKDTRYIFDYTS